MFTPQQGRLMPAEAVPVLEVLIIEGDNGVDPSVSLEVTLASLRAAQVGGHNLRATLGFPAPEGIEALGGDLEIGVRPEITVAAKDGHLALGALASERFYIVLERGQVFPWTVKPYQLFRQGRAAYFGTYGAEDALQRARAAIVSGFAAPTAVLPASPAVIYSAALAQRALIMLQSMYGPSYRTWKGDLASEAALYGLMNEDRMHIDHFLVERASSPLGNIPSPATDMDRPYARLTGN